MKKKLSGSEKSGFFEEKYRKFEGEGASFGCGARKSAMIARVSHVMFFGVDTLALVSRNTVFSEYWPKNQHIQAGKASAWRMDPTQILNRILLHTDAMPCR